MTLRPPCMLPPGSLLDVILVPFLFLVPFIGLPGLVVIPVCGNVVFHILRLQWRHCVAVI